MRMVALSQVVVLAAALGCAAPAARAQTTPPPAGTPAGAPNQPPQGQGAGEAGAPVAIPRFSIQRVDGGYLHLDAENGSVAFCAPRNPSWNCQSVSDDRTGAEKEVVCTPRGDPDWSCQSLNVDRAELVKEIARLQEQITSLKQKFDGQQDEVTPLKKEVVQRQEEITSLKQEVARRQEEARLLKQEMAALRAPPPPPPADRNGELTITLPSRDDIARAGTYLQDTAKDAWQRLVDMISHFQKDVMRRS
jgi:hypothetical protein